MPRKYKKGGESRLSLEGLQGAEIDGKVVKSIRSHGQRRRERTVKWVGGGQENLPIFFLLDELIKSR